MQSSQTIFPIIHPKHIHRNKVMNWKDRLNKHGKRAKKVTQYGIVAMV